MTEWKGKMKVLERLVQHVYTDKWAELEAIDKEFNVVEAKHGFPHKRRYQLISGSDELNTLVIEYEWDSMASMETAYEKLMADPVYQSLGQRSNAIVRDNRMELYTPLP
jgi:hypothetical protein